MKIRHCVHNGGLDPCGAHPWDLDCSNDEVITKQEFSEECDINLIIARCVKSGMPLPSLIAAPLFADVSEVGTFDDCVRRVTVANEAFNALPPSIRTAFDNQPSKLLSFLADPANVSKAIELGLIDKPVVLDPAKPVSAGAAASPA